MTSVGLKWFRLTTERNIGHGVWEWRCDCGNAVKARVASVRGGNTKSCGCLKREHSKRLNTKHGLSKTSEYTIWKLMKARCLRPQRRNYPHYGGRGIQVCERWQRDFESFLADVGPRPSASHSIDRIDNNGHYEPGNVRWATRVEQGRNRRSNIWIEAHGRRQTLAEWARETGLSKHTIKRRLGRGDMPEAALKAKENHR